MVKTAKEATKAISPIRVCMHVLTDARNDTRVIHEATALLEAGFEVSIVDIEDQHNQPLEEEIQGIHVKHILMPASFITTRFTQWALVRAAKLLILGTFRLIQAPADIYHAHDLAGLPGCYIAARFHRKPLIFDAHELPLAELSNGFFHRIRPLLSWLLVRLLADCAGIITVSPPIAQELRNRYHIPAVSLVYNIAPYRAVPKSDRLRQLLGLGRDVRIALFQGNLQANRCLDILIRAAAFLEPDIMIVMMGKLEEPFKSELEALITSEGVANRVKIVPPVPYEELLNWTASADLGLIVYPPEYSLNVQMCLPTKFFEYLMAGLPVLASQLNAVAEIIKTYDVGQVVSSLAPTDVDAAINAMLSDCDALTRMRHNALEASRSEFCWEKESNRLIHLYSEILGARNIERRGQKMPSDQQMPDTDGVTQAKSFLRRR